MLRARTTPPTCITVRRAGVAGGRGELHRTAVGADGSAVALRRASIAATGTLIVSRPEPVGSTLTALPATSAVVPPGVLIVPAFATRGPARTTWPPDCGDERAFVGDRGREASLPLLMRSRPCMNCVASTASEVATRLPTLDLRARREQHAVGVLQVDVAVGGERAEDLARPRCR